MNQDTIINKYFEWLFGLVCGKRYSKHISYKRLLMRLHDTKFIYSMLMDENRAEDGVDLRYRFGDANDCLEEVYLYLNGQCSVLEMMVALAVRCEEHLMCDSDYGDRTSQWFWGMITNLGLGSMTDDRFDRDFVDETIDIFLHREYEPNGKGGLFTIKECKYDLRTIDIWYQLNWYLNSIT